MLLMRAETVLVPRYNWSAGGLFAKMLYISAEYKINIRGRPVKTLSELILKPIIAYQGD